MKTTLVAALVLLGLFVAAQPSHAGPRPAPAATPIPLPSPDKLLYEIRRQFRTHRPPPPYITYTLIRKQTLDDGYPDAGATASTYHIWCRNTDRAALGRRVYRGSARGTLEFLRPSFNEPWDPGPPTADVFSSLPRFIRIRACASSMPTPGAGRQLPPVIASVTVLGEFDYRVTRIADEGGQTHVSLMPRRDPDRNRLRELYVDRKTLELQEVVATDKPPPAAAAGAGRLRRYVYPMLFTVSLSWMHSMPIVTQHIHGTPTYEKDADYLGRDATVDYDFKDIVFPDSLPDWYFDPRDYAQNVDNAPN